MLITNISYKNISLLILLLIYLNKRINIVYKMGIFESQKDILYINTIFFDNEYIYLSNDNILQEIFKVCTYCKTPNYFPLEWLLFVNIQDKLFGLQFWTFLVFLFTCCIDRINFNKRLLLLLLWNTRDLKEPWCDN